MYPFLKKYKRTGIGRIWFSSSLVYEEATSVRYDMEHSSDLQTPDSSQATSGGDAPPSCPPHPAAVGDAPSPRGAAAAPHPQETGGSTPPTREAREVTPTPTSGAAPVGGGAAAQPIQETRDTTPPGGETQVSGAMPVGGGADATLTREVAAVMENDAESNPNQQNANPSSTSSLEGADAMKPKRKRRRNFCPHCNVMVTNYSRHFVHKHTDKETVQQYIALSEEPPKKRKLLRAQLTNKIKNSANNEYNVQVVEGERVGGFLPLRRPKSDATVVDNTTHVTCNHCMAFVKKTSFYRHVANCKEYTPSEFDVMPVPTRRKVLPKHASLLVPDTECASDFLKQEVFPIMQRDADAITAQSDRLICKFGSEFRNTHRDKGRRQIYYCSSRLRGLARLLNTVKSINPDIKELSDCIRPQFFGDLMESIRRMSKFNAADCEVKAPSVPARLCSSLKRCANIMKSDTIKDEFMDKRSKKEIIRSVEYFLHLMDKEWATEVSSNSEKSRRRMKVIKEDLLPHPEDIGRFARYIDGLCDEYMEALKQLPNVAHYEDLAKVIICHMIVLCRRRPTETVETTMEFYHKTLNKNTHYGEDRQTVITEQEMESAERLSIFYTAGCKNRHKVPIMMIKKFHAALELLIQSREQVGVKSKYLFGRPGQVELFEGSAVLSQMAAKAPLKAPKRFTANALRHHAATSSQLHAEDANYSKRLAKHMGHDRKTQENHYEIPLPLVQRCVVGHQLLSMYDPTPATVTSRNATATATATTSTSTTTTNSSDLPSNHAQETSCNAPLFGDNDVDMPSSSSEETTRDTLISCDSVQAGVAGGSVQETINSAQQETNAQSNDGEFVTVESQVEGISRILPKREARRLQQAKPTCSASTSFNDDAESIFPTDDSSQEEFVPGTSNHTSAESSSNYDAYEKPPQAPKCTHRKIRWTEAERRVVYEKFGRFFVNNLKPKRADIRKVYDNEAALKGRTLQQVVTYVNNIVTNKHRISTPIRIKIENMVSNNQDTLSPMRTANQ